MRRLLTVLLVLCFAVAVLAADKSKQRGARFDRKNKPMLVGDETFVPKANGKLTKPSSAIGPGKLLMTSTYDYGSNAGGLANLVDYGDGTMAFGRMGATLANTNDRGSWFSYFDGTAWSPVTKVEALRRGWSNISALKDGRSVVVSHVAEEVNVDAAKGLGIWASTITGAASSAAPQWPRMTVDAKDNIIIVSTTAATVNGVGNVKQTHISRDGGATWTNRFLFPDTTTRKPGFTADDQAIASWNDKVAMAVAEPGDDLHLWESADNGATWTYSNVTQYSRDIPVNQIQTRVFDTCDLIYDNQGNVHIFFESLLATQDTAGTAIDLFFDRDFGIVHWSRATGFNEVVSWSDLPGAASVSDNVLFYNSPFGSTGADMTLTGQPNAGIDAQGNIFMLFSALRPGDIDVDTTFYADIYAVGSNNGGRNWGAPTNVTTTLQSEDLWPSIARNIGDSLRFVYSSDGSTGNSIQGNGVAPTNHLYYAIHKSRVPFSTAVKDRPSADHPTAFALHQNFPNPFNPSTEIKFDLATTSRVKLAVYDITGKLVATLVNGKLEAGTHSATWNAGKNPSGLYFTKLETEGFSSVKKMMLVK